MSVPTPASQALKGPNAVGARRAGKKEAVYTIDLNDGKNNRTCDVGEGDTADTQITKQGSTDDFIYAKSQQSLKSSFKINGAGACGSKPEATTAKQVEKPDAEKPPGKPDPVPDPVPDPLPE